MSLEEGLSPLPFVVLMGTASQGILNAWSAWIPPISADGSPFQPGGGWGRGGVASWEMGDPEHGAHG